MKSIRAGMGLGDAIYLQAAVRHLAKKERMRVCTSWPDVFRPLSGSIELAPFTRNGIDRLCHYTTRKGVTGTTQFQDMCITAGIQEPVELKIDWEVTDKPLTDRLLSHGKPVILVQLPRAPMGRTDGFGHELLPDCRAIQRVIDRLSVEFLIVQVGSGKSLFKFSGIDVDLADKTTVCQLLDVASIASGLIGYVSFFVPLAESLSKPALLVWSKLQTKANTAFIRQITPQKVLHRDSSLHFGDGWPADQADPVIDKFISLCRSQRS